MAAGPAWDYNEAFGQCCGYPIERWNKQGVSGPGELELDRSACREPAWRAAHPLVWSSARGMLRAWCPPAAPPCVLLLAGQSGGSAISPEGWRFNICADQERCVVDPSDGISRWYR